ncbi:Protein MAIN-LIKE 1 [Glycine max]|nr:Protein MAIN-LIKE 1 [Glycine max]
MERNVIELKLFSHGRKMTKFGRPAPKIEGLVAASRLSPLIACSLDTIDRGLMFAFVERWHKETSSFHLPVGEVTITLDDVASLLHLSIIGVFHSFALLHIDDVVYMLVELLETKINACHWIIAVRAYLLHLLGCTLFANKSATHMHVVFLDAPRDLTQSGTYAWGIAALVYIICIYEHFLYIGSAIAAEDYDERRLHACRWTSSKTLPVSTYCRGLDRLTPDVVCWIPYGDHRSFREFKVISLFSGHLRWGPLTVIHRPESVVRQFGYIQTILPHPATPLISVEEMDDRWM